jgi:hypothetical protein
LLLLFLDFVIILANLRKASISSLDELASLSISLSLSSSLLRDLLLLLWALLSSEPELLFEEDSDEEDLGLFLECFLETWFWV